MRWALEWDMLCYLCVGCRVDTTACVVVDPFTKMSINICCCYSQRILFITGSNLLQNSFLFHLTANLWCKTMDNIHLHPFNFQLHSHEHDQHSFHLYILCTLLLQVNSMSDIFTVWYSLNPSPVLQDLLSIHLDSSSHKTPTSLLASCQSTFYLFPSSFRIPTFNPSVLIFAYSLCLLLCSPIFR